MDSMTGFGQGSAEGADSRAVVTLRGVNHRFLDLSIRLPEEARGSEIPIQRLLGESLARGRVELVAELMAVREAEPKVELATRVAAAVAAAADELVDRNLAQGELSVADLLRMPEVARVSADAPTWDESAEAVLLEAVRAALEQFVSSRQEEGARLARVVGQKLEELGELLKRLEELRPQVQTALAESLRQRVGELSAVEGLGSERLEQEVALLVDKSNVSEELERLDVHLGHMQEILGQEGAVGKRLDFLVQEIFRELNTLSAKCRNTEMTRISVDGKVLCEELREQLRNVE